MAAKSANVSLCKKSATENLQLETEGELHPIGSIIVHSENDAKISTSRVKTVNIFNFHDYPI